MFCNRIYPMTANNRQNQKISDEKRADLIRMVNESGNIKASAITLQINYENARKIIYNYNKTGQCSKMKVGGYKKYTLTESEITFLRECIDDDCTVTLEELRERVFSIYDKIICTATISKYIKNFNYSFKRLHTVTERSLTEENIQKRREYAYSFVQKVLMERNILFIDETGFKIEMRPFYGYSPINKPPIATSSMMRSRNITVMACLSRETLFYYKLLEVPGNRILFYEFMEELCDFCTNLGYNNTIFVLDNARFHHCAEIKLLVSSKNHELMYLPAYTPIFNPIENMFSQWKNLVRRRNCNSEDELFAAINLFQEIITREDCENYFKHCLDLCYEYISPNN